jgi:hypothetical protein
MAVSSTGLRPKSDYSGKVQKQFTVNYRPVLSSERVLQNNKNPQLSEGNFKEKEKLVAGPRWEPDTKTDWPTDRRSQISFNFNFNFNRITKVSECHSGADRVDPLTAIVTFSHS